MSWRHFFARFAPRRAAPRAIGPRKAYSRNTAGDFYVEEGCCLGCGVPWHEAPDHFAVDKVQCYVKRQPADEAEIRRVISAMHLQEMGCIRYKGRDQKIIAAIRAKAQGRKLIDD
jgi:hypothetical protein